jgi:hypothetical protein
VRYEAAVYNIDADRSHLSGRNNNKKKKKKAAPRGAKRNLHTQNRTRDQSMTLYFATVDRSDAMHNCAITAELCKGFICYYELFFDDSTCFFDDDRAKTK